MGRQMQAIMIHDTGVVYIYIYGWIQVTLGVILNNITSLNIF